MNGISKISPNGLLLQQGFNVLREDGNLYRFEQNHAVSLLICRQLNLTLIEADHQYRRDGVVGGSDLPLRFAVATWLHLYILLHPETGQQVGGDQVPAINQYK